VPVELDAGAVVPCAVEAAVVTLELVCPAVGPTAVLTAAPLPPDPSTTSTSLLQPMATRTPSDESVKERMARDLGAEEPLPAIAGE
jgi:hypothetical protein